MQLVQLSPRDSRKIMVLVMQADVVSEYVERTIVRVCLRGREGVERVWLLSLLAVLQLRERLGAAVLDVREEIVLRDEVACAGVQGSCQEGAHQEVEDWLEGAAELGQRVVDAQLDAQIQKVDVGEGWAVDEHRTHSVEEDLEGAEEGLAEEGVQEEGFYCCREIGIEACDAEGLVVCQMVGLRVLCIS
jgi:hypothetical protein